MTEAPHADDREQRLIEAVVSLAKSFREERDRLARRLSQLEREIDALTFKLDQHQREFPPAGPPVAPSPVASRTRS
jgi:predicted RNase H-like nuclease (RuvC/YqgF family)